MSELVPTARPSFGRYGVTFACTICGEVYEDKDSIIIHPTAKGISNQPVECRLAGMAFERPLSVVALASALNPQAGKPVNTSRADSWIGIGLIVFAVVVVGSMIAVLAQSPVQTTDKASAKVQAKSPIKATEIAGIVTPFPRMVESMAEGEDGYVNTLCSFNGRLYVNSRAALTSKPDWLNSVHIRKVAGGFLVEPSEANRISEMEPKDEKYYADWPIIGTFGAKP